MSTSGCIGIGIGGQTRLVYNHYDSYPAGLGRGLVTQIEEADLSRWRTLASKLKTTESWCGPDFRLTDGEIRHITSWIGRRVDVMTRIRSETQDSEGVIGVAVPAHHAGPLDSGQELAKLLEPVLRHEPMRFFDTISDRLNVILELGLIAPLSCRFLRSPHCEWVYVIDFDENALGVGKGVCDDIVVEEDDFNVWEPGDDGEIEVHAKFPLDDIPSDWEEHVGRTETRRIMIRIRNDI